MATDSCFSTPCCHTLFRNIMGYFLSHTPTISHREPGSTMLREFACLKAIRKKSANKLLDVDVCRLQTPNSPTPKPGLFLALQPGKDGCAKSC